jgi:hypothetical protein
MGWGQSSVPYMTGNIFPADDPFTTIENIIFLERNLPGGIDVKRESEKD